MNAIVYNNTKSLKKNYLIHIILFTLIIMFNFILMIKIVWLKEYLYYLYFMCSILSIIYLIIPIIPLVFILLKKLNKKKIIFFKILTIIFCSVSLIFGLFFSIILMMNAIESPDFCRECPFNLDISYLSIEFNKYFENSINMNDKTLENKCVNRRCLLNSSNKNIELGYEFICNYNPTNEFDELNGPFESEINDNKVSSNYDIICKKIDSNDFNFEKDLIYKYYDICNNFVDFFVCERFDEPKKLSLKENFVCPSGNYMNKLIMFCVLNILVNLIISFFPWKAEYSKYTNIINYYNQIRRPVSISLNSTKNSSKIQNENIKEKVFERSPTETIIVYRERDNYLNLNNLNPRTEINENNNINNNITTNNIEINQIQIHKINFNNNYKESNNEYIYKNNKYLNTEENELNQQEQQNNINNKNYPISKKVLSPERIILSNNKK